MGSLKSVLTRLLLSRRLISPILISPILISPVQPRGTGSPPASTSPLGKFSAEFARFGPAFERAALGLSLVDLDGTVRTVNDQLCAITGRTRRELCEPGKFLQITHPDDQAADRARKSAMRTGEPERFAIEKRYVRPDGSIVWVSYTGSLLRDENGGPAHYLGVIEDITQRKRVEAALAESEERLRLALQAAGLGVRELDLVTDKAFMTPDAERIFGHDEERDASFDKWLSNVHPDDRAIVRANWDRALSVPGNDIVHEYRFRRPDGEWRWIGAYGRIEFRSGSPVRTIGVIQDITVRKQTEIALRESEAKARHQLAELQLIYDNAPVGLCQFDRELRYVRINKTLADINGRSIEDHTGRTFREVVPDIAEKTEALVKRVIATGDAALNVEISGQTPARKGVTRSWITHWLPQPGDNGEVTHINVVAEDITEQKRAQNALAEGEARLRMSQEAGAIGSWDWDVPTNRLHWSELQCRRFGTDPAERDDIDIGHWRNAVHPDDLLGAERKLRAAFTTGDILELEYRIITASGVRWMNGRGHVIRDAAGKAVRMTGIDIDVTERRALEDELRQLTVTLEARVREEVAAREAAQARAAQAERMQALGQLAGGIAHDLNNVLQAAAGSFTLIQRRPNDEAAIRRYAQLGAEAIERGASITGRLLTFGRRGDLRAEAVDVATLLRGVHEILSYTLGADIEVTVHLPDRLPPAFTDKGQLETALINLATNARDAMPLGGRLTFSSFAETIKQGEKGLKAGPYVRLEIADTGTGMDAATLARAREPFFTTKKSGAGTGLGLSMAIGFVEQSDGAISIDSQIGKGTVVTIWLPQAAIEPAGAAEPEPRTAVSGTQAQVLLVDDEQMIREVLARYLADAGYTVRTAASGAEVLVLLDAGEAVDILLTDLSMAGMNGLALIKSVQERFPDIPAILLTGYADDSAEHALTNSVSGTVSLLRKPVSDVQLLDRVSAMLAGAGGNR